MRVTRSGAGGASLLEGSNSLELKTGGSLGLAIDGSQNVGIGTASPNAMLELIRGASNAAAGPSIRMGREDNSTVANDSLGILEFYTSDTSNGPGVAASIQGLQNGTGSAADILFSTGNVATTTERMRINSLGNVGIGTTDSYDPACKFVVKGTGNSRFDVSATNTNNTLIGSNLVLSDDGTTYTTPQNGRSGGGIQFNLINSANNHGDILFLSAPDTNSESSTPVERMRIDSSGKVSIGTDTAQAELHVVDSLTGNNSNITTSSQTVGLFERNGDAEITILSNAANYTAINFSDDIHRRGQIKYAHGSGIDEMRFNTASTQQMVIDSSGNVGIGTANPVSSGSGTKNLHISALGTARLVLTGDSNNIGDTGQLDAAIYMLTDGGFGTDPFGDTSSTNAGAHGYSFRVNNYSGDNTFDIMEESSGTATNLMHMNTNGDVVIGFGSTSVSAGAKFEVASTTSMVIPKGTTAQRPGTAVSGAIRFNTTLGFLEQYNGSVWGSFEPTYPIDYLVLGGGGSGGDCTSPIRFGGGGGAGGLRTSYGTTSGRASSAESPLMVASGRDLIITVGAGAPGGTDVDNTPGTQGSSSSITGISTITALGGGGGGGNTADGTSGGCGGGGNESNGAGQSGTAGQGFDGGTGDETGDRGGGGGGTGANGTGTDGGAGTSVSITGSAVTYGGGGASSGTAGAGGGGAGSSNGTANLGGGGGAAGSQTGAGGSGVVILRVPTTNYSGITTGSPTVTTDGDFTVIKFTSSGTYTT